MEWVSSLWIIVRVVIFMVSMHSTSIRIRSKTLEMLKSFSRRVSAKGLERL